MYMSPAKRVFDESLKPIYVKKKKKDENFSKSTNIIHQGHSPTHIFFSSS